MGCIRDICRFNSLSCDQDRRNSGTGFIFRTSFKAFDDSEIDIFKCSRCYCSGELTNNSAEYFNWNILSDISPLGKDSYQLLLSTEKERVMLQNFRRTLYLNFSMPVGKVKSKSSCFAGIRGWNNLVQNIFGQIRTLEYINNSL